MLTKEQIDQLNAAVDNNARNLLVEQFLNELNNAKDAETKSRVEKIVEANKKALEAKDAEIAAVKTTLSHSEQAPDHNATEAAKARQEMDGVVAAKDATIASLTNERDTAITATATEKAAKEAAEQARDAETLRANGLQTQLNDANTAHAVQAKTLTNQLTIATTNLKSAEAKANDAISCNDSLLTDLDTWNKEVNPDAEKIDVNTNNPIALVKGNVAAKAIADANAKAPEAPKPDNAPQAPNASWSKGRLFALVGAGVLAGCVIGAAAYNNSSTLQSCYKFCADSKVGCKLADFANFICKFFTRSASAEISR